VRSDEEGELGNVSSSMTLSGHFEGRVWWFDKMEKLGLKLRMVEVGIVKS
jgi:hypothetical protein